MNELRMYVEHLFEGKVLTSENIELKEEIYGNLMARYQDYLADGMSEDEALKKTKESVPSIDDVLSPDGELSEDGGSDTRRLDADDAASSAPTQVMDSSSGDSSSDEKARVAGAPVPPMEADVQQAGTSKASRKKWPVVVGIAAAAVLVLGGLWVATNMFVEPAVDRVEDTVANVQDITQGNSGGNAGNNAGNSGQTPTFTDPEDQREYEATTALMQEIEDSTADLLQIYAGRATSSEVADLAAELPLGAHRREAGLDDTATGVAYIDYTEVSEDIDGDAIDLALAYNATAIFSVYPDISMVCVTLQEANDSQWDADTYVFERTSLESSFTSVSDGLVTQLNSSLFESTDAWSQVKGYLDRAEFAEHVVDRAETN